MILALSGTPGTGKSVVAQLLERQLGWKVVELNQLAGQQRLFSGYDRRRKTKIVDIGKVEKAVAELSCKGNLIIVAHYAHDIPNQLTVVLRCDIGELKKRMEKRGWPQKKIEENLQAEIFGVCLEEARELRQHVVELDTTHKRPEAVAQQVEEALKTYKDAHRC